MKKILIFLIGALLLTVNYVNAQVVDGITYQAVAVDEDGKEIAGMDVNGNILPSKTMNVRFTIIEGNSSGSIVYQEIHSTNTDPNGLFSVIIGHGEITNDSPNQSIRDIAWGSNKHFLKVELDTKGFNEYKLMAIQQMMAVPYAFYALNANYDNIENTPEIPQNTSDLNNDSGYITSPDDADSDPTNELQILSISNDTVYLTDGGFVKLPEGFSGDYNDLTNQPTIPTVPTNVSTFTNDAGYLTSFTETQILSISNDTIFLTGGSFVKLPEGFSGDYNDLANQPNIPSNTSDLTNDTGFITSPDDADADPTNELQILSISNDTVYLTDGGFVELPEGFSGDYNDLTNQPTIPTVPTNVSAFTNDAGYLTSFTESQILSISNDTIHLTGGSFVKLPAGFSGDYGDLTNTPDFTGWDTDVSDDFDGDYNNLTNQPAIPTVPTNVSAFTNDAGYLTSFTESQILSISNDTIYLTGGSFVKLPAGFSGDYGDLTNQPNIPSNTSDLTNDSGYITSPEDADSDPTNELQMLSISSDSLFISDGNGVALASFTGSSTSGVKILTVDGSFTVPPSITNMLVEMWGAGGGGGKGGNGTCGSCGFSTSGGGGGSGGYKKLFISVTPGEVINYTIGEGGASQTNGEPTTFGTYSISGGSKGTNGSGPYTSCSGASSGTGGASGLGGTSGNNGCCNSNWGCGGGKGGDAPDGIGFGGSGGSKQTSNGQDGFEGNDGGRAAGGGGGGGVESGSGGGATPVNPTIGGSGGKGGDGLIIITY